MKNLSSKALIIVLLVVVCSISEANFKKSRVSSGNSKAFSFTTTQDGPCTVSLINDTTSADLDTGIAVDSTGDFVCLGVSTQSNYDSCTAGLPPGDFVFVVESFRGSSAFRVVVNCGSQETISAAGQDQKEIKIKEIDLNSHPQGQKMIDQLRSLTEKIKGKPKGN